jgi:hypothetical protein
MDDHRHPVIRGLLAPAAALCALGRFTRALLPVRGGRETRPSYERTRIRL